MKKLLIVLVLLNFGYAYSQTMNDVNGWRDAVWGMSVDSVKNLFTKEKIIENTAKQTEHPFSLFRIAEYEVSDLMYEINFFFTENTLKLNQITISRVMGFSEIALVESNFTGNYGKPFVKEEHPYLCKWNFPSTIIEIDFVEEVSKVMITYKQSE